MGIWDILTKPIKLTSEEFQWDEPMGMRLSLRGDLLLRLGVAASVWAAISGLLWILFAFNIKPPELGVALFTALFIGLGPACMALFARRNHVSASIWVYNDHIIRQRSYMSMSFFGSWREVSEWPNALISRCIIIPDRALGKSFSVMLLTIDSQVEMVGIPQKIKLKELAKHFTEAGIPVEKRDSIPSRYTQGLSPTIFAAAAVVGVLLFSTGLGIFLNRVPRPGNQIVKRENFPDLQQDFPRPEFQRPELPLDPQRNPVRENQSLPRQEAGPDPAGNQPSSPLPGMMRNPAGGPSVPLPGRMSEQLGGRFPNRPGGFPTGPNPNPIPNLPFSSSGRATSTKGNSQPTRGTDSKLIGNPEGGSSFRSVNPQGKAIIGFSYSMGSWDGVAAIRDLTPLYDQSPPRGRSVAVTAKAGYAVGGLKIDAPQYVSAVQIVFYRVKEDGQLDTTDAYTSEWLGKPSGKDAPLIDGAGKKTIGVFGRRGAVIDAVGLVFE